MNEMSHYGIWPLVYSQKHLYHYTGPECASTVSLCVTTSNSDLASSLQSSIYADALLPGTWSDGRLNTYYEHILTLTGQMEIQGIHKRCLEMQKLNYFLYGGDKWGLENMHPSRLIDVHQLTGCTMCIRATCVSMQNLYLLRYMFKVAKYVTD